MRLRTRSLSPEDKVIRKAVIDSWCHRHGVERIPTPSLEIRTEDEILAMGFIPSKAFLARVRPAQRSSALRGRNNRAGA